MKYVGKNGLRIGDNEVWHEGNLEIGGRNLIIRNTETPNTWINVSGSITQTANHDTSDYIKVEPNTDYMLTKSNSELATDAGFFRWSWYDADMVYIGRRASSDNEILWKTPSAVHYIRVSSEMILGIILSRKRHHPHRLDSCTRGRSSRNR